MEQAARPATRTERSSLRWLASRWSRIGSWLWLAWTGLLSIFVVTMAGNNLGNFPNISGDDAWIMSASHKLATEGVFGSDMFRGFANADRHYFIALPVYHFLQAGCFAVFGTGVAQARAVTLASGLVILWCTAWLARRWFGVAVAVVAAGLLVFWRSELMSLASGLSFISVSRTGRYDATGVAFMLLAIVTFERLNGSQDRRWALTTGVLAGLATLTQFFGAFVVPLLVIALLIQRGKTVLRQPIFRWLAAGWLLVIVPYVGYVVAYWSDFVAQSELKGGRIEFQDPSFYLDNLRDEPDRYRHLFDYLTPALEGQYARFDAPLSPFIFGVAAIVALGLLAMRVARSPRHGDRMLALSIGVFGLSLALFDGTNARLYAVILLPLLCIAIALAAVTALRWAASARPVLLRVLVILVVILPSVIVVREGIAAYQQEHEWSNLMVDYEAVTERVDTLLPSGEPVLGAERWWAGLYREHEYISLTAITQQWVEAGDEGEQPEWLARLLAEYRISAIIIDDHARGMIQRLPAPLRRQFDDVIRNHGQLAGTMGAHPYGEIEVYLISDANTETEDLDRFPGQIFRISVENLQQGSLDRTPE